MKSLIEAKIVDDIVKIESAPRFFVKFLCVRAAYRELYDVIANGRGYTRRIDLVLGDPGIGKTLFLQFFLMKLLQGKEFKRVIS